MLKDALDAIQKLGQFSPEEIELVSAELHPEMIQKGEFLLKAGEVCQAAWFLNQGSMRQFMLDNENAEHTRNLFVEKDWILDDQSFTSQGPSLCNIQAFDTCEVLKLSIHSIHALIGKSASFFQIGKLLASEPFRRDSNTAFLSLEEKYLNLITNRPHIVQTFPLKHIASYLGMTPETLSRIRRKLVS